MISSKNYRIVQPELLLNHPLMRTQTTFSPPSAGRGYLFDEREQKAFMMYKTIHDLAPKYLQSLFSQRHSAYNLRNSEGRLTLSKPNTNYLKRSFSYSEAMLWNNLAKNLRNAASVEHFKRNIKKVADISDSHTAIM